MAKRGYSDEARKNAAIARAIKHQLGDQAWKTFQRTGKVPPGLDMSEVENTPKKKKEGKTGKGVLPSNPIARINKDDVAAMKEAVSAYQELNPGTKTKILNALSEPGGVGKLGPTQLKGIYSALASMHNSGDDMGIPVPPDHLVGAGQNIRQLLNSRGEDVDEVLESPVGETVKESLADKIRSGVPKEQYDEFKKTGELPSGEYTADKNNLVMFRQFKSAMDAGEYNSDMLPDDWEERRAMLADVLAHEFSASDGRPDPEMVYAIQEAAGLESSSEAMAVDKAADLLHPNDPWSEEAWEDYSSMIGEFDFKRDHEALWHRLGHSPLETRAAAEDSGYLGAEAMLRSPKGMADLMKGIEEDDDTLIQAGLQDIYNNVDDVPLESGILELGEKLGVTIDPNHELNSESYLREYTRGGFPLPEGLKIPGEDDDLDESTTGEDFGMASNDRPWPNGTVIEEVRGGDSVDITQTSTEDLLDMVDANESGSENWQYDSEDTDERLSAMDAVFDELYARPDLHEAINSRSDAEDFREMFIVNEEDDISPLSSRPANTYPTPVQKETAERLAQATGAESYITPSLQIKAENALLNGLGEEEIAPLLAEEAEFSEAEVQKAIAEREARLSGSEPPDVDDLNKRLANLSDEFPDPFGEETEFPEDIYPLFEEYSIQVTPDGKARWMTHSQDKDYGNDDSAELQLNPDGTITALEPIRSPGNDDSGGDELLPEGTYSPEEIEAAVRKHREAWFSDRVEGFKVTPKDGSDDPLDAVFGEDDEDDINFPLDDYENLGEFKEDLLVNGESEVEEAFASLSPEQVRANFTKEELVDVQEMFGEDGSAGELAQDALELGIDSPVNQTNLDLRAGKTPRIFDGMEQGSLGRELGSSGKLRPGRAEELWNLAGGDEQRYLDMMGEAEQENYSAALEDMNDVLIKKTGQDFHSRPRGSDGVPLTQENIELDDTLEEDEEDEGYDLALATKNANGTPIWAVPYTASPIYSDQVPEPQLTLYIAAEGPDEAQRIADQRMEAAGLRGSDDFDGDVYAPLGATPTLTPLDKLSAEDRERHADWEESAEILEFRGGDIGQDSDIYSRVAGLQTLSIGTPGSDATNVDRGGMMRNLKRGMLETLDDESADEFAELSPEQITHNFDKEELDRIIDEWREPHPEAAEAARRALLDGVDVPGPDHPALAPNKLADKNKARYGRSGPNQLEIVIDSMTDVQDPNSRFEYEGHDAVVDVSGEGLTPTPKQAAELAFLIRDADSRVEELKENGSFEDPKGLGLVAGWETEVEPNAVNSVLDYLDTIAESGGETVAKPEPHSSTEIIASLRKSGITVNNKNRADVLRIYHQTKDRPLKMFELLKELTQ